MVTRLLSPNSERGSSSSKLVPQRTPYAIHSHENDDT